CARTGQRSCVAGQIADSCVAGAPTSASDTTCDGVDDNCDGRADEGYASVPTSCGPGACASSGTRACVNGAIVDSCVANMPSGIPETTCNNVDDDCDTRVDENFMSSTTMCGVGECARTGTRTCNAGVLADSCRAGTPSTSVDSSCNNVDNDCDGRIDESFVASDTQCGVGACRSTGRTSCVSGMTRNSCVARTPSTTVDDATVPGNGIDDDCDGRVDENVPACDTSARSYEAGSHTITVPGNCHNVSVRLWGGGGGGGASAGLADGGNGGAGGYATASVLVAGAINLYVGGAGASGCNNAGTNAGSSSYNGGSGGTSTGANGNDGNVSGGGTGGAPSTGARGGNGYYGGGGGGQGSGGLGTSGNGGGGGAASVFIVNGVRAAVAGGGGGGGGAQAITILGTVSAAGGNAGSGCRGNGQAPNANGGGGGGGGACQGASTQSGSGTTPAASGDIPSGRARGGTSSCGAGGAGYAIVTFSP
ncbi:MAG: MopE-related protein, partial [Polyangiales bacterium]